MSDYDYKKSVSSALNKFYTRELREHKKLSKPKGNPEEIFAETVLRPWLKEKGFDICKTDSAHGDYEKSRVDEIGHSDYSGDYHGLAVFIETKAPGSRNRLSMAQYIFLRKKILRGCFACVTDSLDHFKKLWERFMNCPDFDEKIEFLMADLPENKKVLEMEKPGPLFDE